MLGGGIVSDDVEEEGEEYEALEDEKVEEVAEDEADEDSESGTAARHAPKSTIHEGFFLTDGIRVVGATAAP